VIKLKSNSRIENLFRNLTTNILLEVITILSAIILPKLYIDKFGSNQYGLITSVTQIFGYLALFQSGIGNVIKSNLYKPLANNDTEKISAIYNTSKHYFAILALFSILFTIILIFIFPYLRPEVNNHLFISIILIISLSMFIQYLIGSSNYLLLHADQKSYILNVIQSMVVLVNLGLVVYIINLNKSLVFVKLVSIIIYSLIPITISIYVRIKYKLKKNIKVNYQILKQRWDAFGHTIAYFIHSKTDVLLITLFLDFTFVSVYSIIQLITSGLNTFINIFSNSLQPIFGNMFSKNEVHLIQLRFKQYELLNYMIVTTLYSTALITIFPFLDLYTKNFVDKTKFINKYFIIIFCLAEFFFSVRLPYHSFVITKGDFKQTKNGAYLEAFLNFSISIILISKLGLVGVVIGTLVAMVFRTMNLIIYVNNNILKRSYLNSFKNLTISFLYIIFVIFIINILDIRIVNFLTWILISFVIVISNMTLIIFMNYIFNKSEIIELYNILKKFIVMKLNLK